MPLEIHSISIARNAEAGPEERTANTAEEMRRILKKRKKAGIDKLIEEYNNQIQAYIAENNITGW